MRINPKDIIPADDEEEEEPKDQEGAARLLRTSIGEGIGQCTICLDALCVDAIVPCGHVCICPSCLKHVNQCPVCRTPMTGLFRIYLS